VTHPGIESVRSLLEESGFNSGTIADRRAAMEQMLSSSPPAGVEVRADRLGGRPAEWIAPEVGRTDTVVLYLHGGGYCIGSLGTHRELAARLATASGSAVATLDYRLAPEHPFPGAVDDACAAFVELLDRGFDPASVAIAGDSAGGGLTVATALALRSRGGPLPAALVCLSPWADLTQSGASYTHRAASDPMVTKAGLDEMAAAYLAGADARVELASPVFSDHLGGLPPVMVEVGDHEVLLDDSVELVVGIRAAGGTATLTVWPELVHVFQAFPSSLVPESDQSLEAVAAFLSDRFPPAR
jgi:phosphinothricin tripeptide acetyl hydrolase